MLGGCGLVIAAAAFFGWRNSEKQWQRVGAWIRAIWGGVSILIILLALSSTSR